ncbi:PhnD/SsuA/transferrin family substrate-binding protein [Sutterella sp.]|uniref:sensor histidine kinase n=1 Tax=Sutterella sp. TaxID=1981025 RepID=UPI0026DF5AAC|nr:PhnD/SsuA/transferrin family substrate-binding protein [Sutterella sp.]MDO5532150.1 PhnD/SsuA/transferrin family substrate-binding protein [Sutterella sp.]
MVGQSEVRIGFLAYSPPWYDGAFVDESVRYLSWRSPRIRFTVSYLSQPELEAAIGEGRVDAVVAPASFLALITKRPLHELATIVSDAAADSNRSVAATVIVRRDREDIRTLADLRGRSVATVTAEPSPGLLEVEREVARLGHDPEKFFGSIQTVTRLRMKEVLNAVMSGKADAGILRSCFLEDLWRAGNRTFEKQLKVLDNREEPGFACSHSTPFYPGWIFAGTETLTQEAARAITATLLTKPANAWGQHWTVSTNASSYTDLFRTLRIGPYAYLREWTVERIWEEWRPLIVLVFLALAGVLTHGVVLEKLVRRRTRELERMHAEQQAADRQAREMTERLDQLQRAGAVGQISSIVAHEMKQPLAVIQNLSRGTLRMIEDEPETLDELSRAIESINDEAVRAAAIVDRVRGYSQGRSNRQTVDFPAAVREAVGQFRATRRGRLALIDVGNLEEGAVRIDPLDLKLIIVNLLANAAEACRNQPKPRVKVSLKRLPAQEHAPEMMEFTVADNGPRLTDEAFAALGRAALKSTKSDGLGLGLMIVRSLAENCVGRLTFERAGAEGLAAVVTLPVESGGTETIDKENTLGEKE